MFKKFSLILSEERQKNIYKNLYKEHKISYKTLHWSSKESQFKRFEILIKPFDLNNKNILDIGSGFGDFFDFLKKKKIKAKMTGYEIIPEFIKTSQRKHPCCSFKPINLALVKPARKFDFVFSSGVFAFGDKTFFNTMVKNAYESARVAYSFNIYHSQHDKRFLSLSTTDIYSILKSLKPADIKIETGYIKNDITFYLFKKKIDTISAKFNK